MRKKSTRLLSAALAVCMMLSVLPVGAFAAEPGAEEQENGASAQADPVDSEFAEINNRIIINLSSKHLMNEIFNFIIDSCGIKYTT